MRSPLVVVPTGTANIASVLAAFRRLGAEPMVTSEPEIVATADRVVLPGVGSFDAAIGELDRTGMRPALWCRLYEGRPTLAICVGMQLLAETSEESDGAVGLCHVPTRAVRLPEEVTVPQLGWNRVVADPACRFLTDGWAYFANSYRLEAVPPGWSAATADHGGEFVAGIEQGDVLACQFHPELSGPWGAAMLQGWAWPGRPV